MVEADYLLGQIWRRDALTLIQGSIGELWLDNLDWLFVHVPTLFLGHLLLDLVLRVVIDWRCA